MSSTTAPATNVAPPPSYDLGSSPQGALLAAIIKSQCANRAAAGTDVELHGERLEELRREIAEAIAAAREAEEDGGFWSDIADFLGEDLATIAGALAAAAAVVASGGSGAPLVTAVLAAGLEIGAKVGAELGLSPEVSMALGLTGAAVGLCTGNAGRLASLATLADDVRAAATIVGGAAAGAGGLTGAVAQDHQSRALELHAYVSFVRALEEGERLEIADALGELEKAFARQARAANVAADVARTNQIAAGNLIANVGGS